VSVVVRQTLVPLLTPARKSPSWFDVPMNSEDTALTRPRMSSGVTAEYLGATSAVLLGGIGTLLIVAIWMKLFPALARVDRLDRSP
ncbi:MAG: MFS transporter, partial [Pseudorhodoplanes sp.]|nr:MFS transporter [Pseudorhodoplanes sp.]